MESKNPFTNPFKVNNLLRTHLKRSNKAHSHPAMPFEMRDSIKHINDMKTKIKHRLESIDFQFILRRAKVDMMLEVSFGPTSAPMAPIGVKAPVQADSALHKLLINRNITATNQKNYTNKPYHPHKNTGDKLVNWSSSNYGA